MLPLPLAVLVAKAFAEAAPPVGVSKVRLPLPSVVSTWPSVPSETLSSEIPTAFAAISVDVT